MVRKIIYRFLMKRYLLLVLSVLFITPLVFSQNRLNEFVIEKDSGPQVFFRSQGCTPNDGAVVINTLIPNLKFSMPDAPRRMRHVSDFDSENNRYVLCLQPTDTVIAGISKYSIDVSAPNYKTATFYVEKVSAGKTQYFKVDPKRADSKKGNPKKTDPKFDSMPIKKRKPLIGKDWTKDFKLIVGLSNGIVASEIWGFYGEIKFGEKNGFALEGGYSPDFLNYVHDERWSFGVKGYYYNCFLSCHYGSIVDNKNTSFTIKDDGTFLLPTRASLFVGYDRTFGLFHLTAGLGGTITTYIQPKFLFAWNVGVGFSCFDLFH